MTTCNNEYLTRPWELPGGDELDGAAAALVPEITQVSQALADEQFVEIIRKAITRTNKNPTCCPDPTATIKKVVD